jgi:hypothetical protein
MIVREMDSEVVIENILKMPYIFDIPRGGRSVFGRPFQLNSAKILCSEMFQNESGSRGTLIANSFHEYLP